MLHSRMIIINTDWRRSMELGKQKPITLFGQSLENPKQGHRRLYLQRPTQHFEAQTSQSLLRVAEGGDHESPPKHPKDKSGLDASAKLTRAKLNKRSRDAGLSKDKLGLESSPKFWRSWYVKRHVRSGVISSVLAQRYLRAIRQRYSPREGPQSLLGDEGLSSGGNQLNSIFIIADVTFTKPKQPIQKQLKVMLSLNDIMESVISCVSAKETWTDLVHSFEGPSDTKENRIMDLKLEYQTFRAKSTESLSQTYTRYKTLLNELANDGGLRNANHTQTLDLADIYMRFFYKDNLIQRRYSDTKKALITTPLSTPISTDFFSNNVIHDFQENSNDEVDERSSEEYLRDLDIEYHERALLTNLKRVRKGK
ncbi:hypothetical protein Tco_0616070 [Tanacetum coccineum]